MGVFTIFFCGTSSNSFDVHNPLYPSGELVSTLASNHAGKEFVDWIIVDGPGSGNLQEDQKWSTPGNYSTSRGQLSGAGWEENVAHAIQVLKGSFTYKRSELTASEYNQLKKANIPIPDAVVNKGYLYNTTTYPQRRISPQELQAQKVKIFRKNQAIDSVNLMGWSRGGVSCIMMANAMYADPALRGIPVRIFAVDPVPGLGRFQRHRTQLAQNVVSYTAVYARDERSKGFAPIVPELPRGLTGTLLSMPGRHATLVGNGAIDGATGRQELHAPGKLVRNIAETVLSDWGTPLKKTLDLELEDVLKLYEEMVRDDHRYAAMRAHTYTGLKDETFSERTVGVGVNGTGVHFSGVKGQQYDPPQGLSNLVANWHHALMHEWNA